MKVLDDDYGPPRCQECGERFMGEPRAEVVMLDEHTQECLDAQFMHHAATGGDLEDCHCPGVHKVVHAETCYDKERMVLA